LSRLLFSFAIHFNVENENCALLTRSALSIRLDAATPHIAWKCVCVWGGGAENGTRLRSRQCRRETLLWAVPLFKTFRRLCVPHCDHWNSKQRHKFRMVRQTNC